jgi:hypothetical protein
MIQDGCTWRWRGETPRHKFDDRESFEEAVDLGVTDRVFILEGVFLSGRENRGFDEKHAT